MPHAPLVWCSHVREPRVCSGAAHTRASGTPGASCENVGLLQWIWVGSRTGGRAAPSGGTLGAAEWEGHPRLHVPRWSLFCLGGGTGGKAERKEGERGWWERDREGGRQCTWSRAPKLPQWALVVPPTASEAPRSSLEPPQRALCCWPVQFSCSAQGRLSKCEGGEERGE